MKYTDPESSILELKRELPKNDQLIKTLIGFCNRFGGTIVVGVDDDGTIVGIDPDEVEKVMEYLDKSIYEATSPPILPLVYARRLGERTLLYIEVSSGMNKPYYKRSEGLEKGAFIRLGRSTVRATMEMIEELKWNSRGINFENLPVYHTTKEALDLQKIEKFFNSRKGIPPISVTEEVLKGYKILVQEHGSTYLTVAGTLLFGKDPQYYFSEAMIICSRFAGTEGREVIATRDCTGTLFEQFENAYNFMLTHLDKAFTIKGPQRTEELELPEHALREVLLNLLVHRNYYINAPAKIAIYDNRIEVFSPGDFPGPLDPKKLMKGLTFLRNPLICRIFREAGYIEKLGTGFITLFTSFEKRGLKKPEVIEDDSFVKCILPRKKEKANEDDVDTKKILELFATTNQITISDVMEFLKTTRSTAGRRLTQLQNLGMIVKKGRGKGVHYCQVVVK